MSSIPGPFGDQRHPYGLPRGTVRGFMSVLICAFFWIYLLLPDPKEGQRLMTVPLAHFFLLTLVLLSFASHPIPHDAQKSELLPWLMRVMFVGGSLAVVVYVAYKDPARLGPRLTPEPEEIGQWPALLGALAGGFGAGLFARYVLGRESLLFQSIRGWVGVIAILLLVAETVFQFAIRPALAVGPHPDALKIWEGVIIAFVAAYFGTRA